MSQLIHGDCLDVLPTLADHSVDLILVDPPYYRVKSETWDRQWASRASYLTWLETLCQQWQRILTPNGSLYCFASPQLAAHVEVLIDRHFHVVNSLVWQKGQFGRHCSAHKEGLRGFFPNTERIIFAEQYGADSMALGESGYAAQCERLHGFVFEPLRAYLDGERRRAGIDKADCNAACGFARIAGGMASRHYFSRSQWALPTAPHYAALRSLFNAKGRPTSGPYLTREYEDLRREYEDLRREYEDLRRPFQVTEAVPYTDVWTFSTVPPRPGKHPCEKPSPLLEHIITASSRPGALVLDCFAGSMSTAIAALRTGREYLCIERDAGYFTQGAARVARELAAAQQAALIPQDAA